MRKAFGSKWIIHNNYLIKPTAIREFLDKNINRDIGDLTNQLNSIDWNSETSEVYLEELSLITALQIREIEDELFGKPRIEYN